MNTGTYVVVGLGFGDEGKGTTVDALVRRTGADLVVRFNGGPQAAHNVVTPKGRHHTFSQWGSGTFVGCRTLLSHYMAVDPLAMIPEAEHLESVGVKDPWSLLTVDPHCVVITPYHRELNRVRDSVDKHGTCGVGFGEAVNAAFNNRPTIRWEDLSDPRKLYKKLEEVDEDAIKELSSIGVTIPALDMQKIVDRMTHVWSKVSMLPTAEGLKSRKDKVTVFEGAQGIMLDENFGFHPHTTWSTCTSQNARTLIYYADMENPQIIGVVRAEYTRHGTGPFPTETTALPHPDEHNSSRGIQGAFRIGIFDAVLARYALAVDRNVTHLAITCLDRLKEQAWVCNSYEYQDGLMMDHLPRPINVHGQRALSKAIHGCRTLQYSLRSADLPSWVRQNLDKPVVMKSYSNTYEGKEWILR